ncbi:MAG: amidase [Syntrophobacteraceae bacterium]
MSDENLTATATSGEDIAFLSASRLAEMIRNGETTSLEVVEACLARVKKHNARINAFVTVDEEGARKRAREADAAFKKGQLWGPLHGVPVSAKDNYATAGIRTASGFPPLANFAPDFDAAIVARLKDAGAILLGKTALPPFGMDFQTRGPLSGVTNNPWDIGRTPGGSSGGSAAAVASGMSPLCLGNDLGGSIRVPAHFCGIYGLKPTENLIPWHGISPGRPAPAYRSFRHMLSLGPLARSVEDLELCLRIIAGPHSEDPDVPCACLREVPEKPLSQLRIAWSDDFGSVPVDSEILAAMRRFTDALSRKGIKVERAAPGGFDLQAIWRTYGRISDMEFAVLTPKWLRFTNHFFGKSFRKDVPFSQSVYPATFGRYMTELSRRDKFTGAFETFLGQWDAWLCPVSSTPAFSHLTPKRYIGASPIYDQTIAVNGQPVNYWVANGACTIPFNLTGSPVVVIPIGHTAGGLPIGVQIVGRRWRDMELLALAGQLDTIAGVCKRPPE